jgi:hypothetical protein
MPELSSLSVYLIVVFSALTVFAAFTLKRTSHSSTAIIRIKTIGSVTVYVALLYLVARFPEARPNFAVEADQGLIFLLVSVFACVIFGTVAEYFYGLANEAFSWRRLLTPLCVSPLVMLPLIGSLPNENQITTLQWVSLGFLGFQNGFFWRKIFEKVSTQ